MTIIDDCLSAFNNFSSTLRPARKRKRENNKRSRNVKTITTTVTITTITMMTMTMSITTTKIHIMQKLNRQPYSVRKWQRLLS